MERRFEAASATARSNSVRSFDAASGEQLATVELPPESVILGIGFDGQTPLVVRRHRERTELIKLREGRAATHELHPRSVPPMAAIFDPVSDLFVTVPDPHFDVDLAAGKRMEVELWTANDSEPAGTWDVRGSAVSHALFYRRDMVLLGGGSRVALFVPGVRRPLLEYEVRGTVLAMEWTPSRRRVLVVFRTSARSLASQILDIADADHSLVTTIPNSEAAAVAILGHFPSHSKRDRDGSQFLIVVNERVVVTRIGENGSLTGQVEFEAFKRPDGSFANVATSSAGFFTGDADAFDHLRFRIVSTGAIRNGAKLADELHRPDLLGQFWRGETVR